MSKHSSSGRSLERNRFSDEVATIVKDLSNKLHQLLMQHEACILGTAISGSADSTQSDIVRPFAQKYSDNQMQDTLVSDVPLPIPPHGVKPLTSFDEPETIVLPWCSEPQGEPRDANCEARTSMSSATSGHLGKLGKPYGTKAFKAIRTLELRSCWSDVTDELLIEAIQNTEGCANISGLSSVKSNLEPRRRLIPYAEVGSARTLQRCLNTISSGIMHPAGQPRAVWNVATFIVICSDILAIPLLAFDLGDTPPWEVFAWFCTLFWTADMAMSFRTGFFVGVKVEMRQVRIVKQYAKTWLPLDAFIVLFEWSSRFYSSMAPAHLVRTTRVVRAVRLVKLLRMAKMKDLVSEFTERVKSNVAYLMLQIFMLTMLLCVGTHFVTCLWYALGQSVSDGWTSYDLYALRDPDLVDEMGFAYWYVSSSRWVVSQLNGRTDMDERRNMRERAFTVVGGLLLSLVWHAIFISLITKAMLQLSDLFKKQSERRRLVNDYLSLYAIPNPIERVIKYHAREYKDSDAEKQREAVVLALLPKQLQSDLLYEVRKPLLTSHPFFRILVGEFVTAGRRVCYAVAQRVYAVRDELIFDKDCPCSRMLVVDTGSLIYDQRHHTPDDLPQQEPSKNVDNARHLTFAFSKRRRSSHGSSTRPDELYHLTSGVVVSEGALWVTWVNKGQLLTEDNCGMLEIEATLLAESLQQYADAFGLAVVYAKRFLQTVEDETLLSDIEPCEVLNFRSTGWTAALKNVHEIPEIVPMS